MRRTKISLMLYFALVSGTLTGCTTTRLLETGPVETDAGEYSMYSTKQHARKTHLLVAYAKSLKGTPYRMGGTSPTAGFDCSGFVQHVFGRHGIALPRTVEMLAARLPRIDPDQLSPGDLVFFNTRGKTFSHVGIYLGKQFFIHAPGGAKSRTVRVSKLSTHYWVSAFTGARRPMALQVTSRSERL